MNFPFSRKPQRVRPQSPKLRLESLEGRQLLAAADVLAGASPGTAAGAASVQPAVSPATSSVIASSNFTGSTFTPGESVNGQGSGDTGWSNTWQQTGGESNQAEVVTTPSDNGAGAVQLFATNIFGASIEREWSAIDPVVRVDMYLYITPGSQVQGQVVNSTPTNISNRTAGSFQIQDTGAISVFNEATDQYIATGMHTLPDAWNEYSLIVDTNTSTYEFAFNNQVFESGQALEFENPLYYVNGISIVALGTLTSYIGPITVSSTSTVPGINPVATQAVTENAGSQSVTLTGITLADTITATSNNPGLIPNPTISFTSEAASATLNYVPATNTVGTAVITLTLDNDFNETASETFDIDVGQVQPTLTVTDNSGTYDGQAFTATDTVAGVGSQSTPSASLEGVTPTLTYYSGPSATGSALSSAPTAAGTYTVLASFAGSTDYASGLSSTTFTISQATPSVSVADSSGTYTGSAFVAIDSVAGVGSQSTAGASLESVTPNLTYYSGTSVTGVALTGAPSIAGTYSVLASFAGSTDYTSGATSVTFTISQATPTLAVSDAGGIYSSTPYPATVTISGVSSEYEILVVPQIHVGGSSLEGVTPSLTYYSGSLASGTALSGAPSTVGTYTVLASFAGSTDYTSDNASATFTITHATPTINVSDAGGMYNGSAYTASDSVAGVGSQSAPGGSLESTTPTLSYYSGSTASGTPVSGAPTTAGTYTVVASFAGSTDYTSGRASATFTICRATPTLSVNDSGGVYSGLQYPASVTISGGESQFVQPAVINALLTDLDSGSSLEGVTPSLTYFSGTVASGSALSGAPSTVGTYTVLASFAGSTDYTSDKASATFTITQATPTVHVSDAGGTVSGNTTFPAMATVTGVSSVAGSSLEGVSLVVTYYSGGAASGTALGAAPSAAGTYTALASFAGSTDYTSASASVEFSITSSQVGTPTLVVSDPSGVYTDAPFTATVTVNGAGSLQGVTPSVHYFIGTSTTGNNWTTTPPSLVGTYSVLASFAGSTDYSSVAGSTTLTISKATPTVTVSDAGGSYSGAAFPASDSVAGVHSQSAPATSLEEVTPTLAYYSGAVASGSPLSGAPSAAGTYTAVASFAGSTDYTSAAASRSFTIVSKTAAVLTVSDGGPYTSYGQPATVLVDGASSLQGVTPLVHYYGGATATGNLWSINPPSLAGTYTVLASFAGSTSYASAAASQTFTITKATPAVAITDAGGTYSGLPFPAKATVAGVGSQATASTTYLESGSLTLMYFSGTAATGTPLTTAPSAVGIYTALASFGGSADYATAAASVTFTIAGKSTPSLTLSASGGSYTSSGQAATVQLNGGSSLQGVSPVLHYFSGTSATGNIWSLNAPTVVGTYTVLASFAGSTNYASSESSRTFTITKATPTVTVTDAGGTYNGGMFVASDSIAGVGAQSTAAYSLEGTTLKLTYYSGTATTGTPLANAPSAVGTYTALASFAGSADYTSASSSVTFQIMADPLITVSSGNNQTAQVGSAFAQQLAVVVTNLQGKPVSGAQVTFTLPVSGASGTFAGGLTTVVVPTNPQGIAVAPLLTANGTAGTFTVTASTPGESEGLPAEFNLKNVLA